LFLVNSVGKPQQRSNTHSIITHSILKNPIFTHYRNTIPIFPEAAMIIILICPLIDAVHNTKASQLQDFSRHFIASITDLQSSLFLFENV